jgi:hypothetical protein
MLIALSVSHEPSLQNRRITYAPSDQSSILPDVYKNKTQGRIFKQNDPEVWNRNVALNAWIEPMGNMVT